MSEYWKSTPKYWCKHCACYVRDTKLERQNHESTAKHQGALKRFLRDLHRGHEREEREKERARQEVARLNGVVAGSSSSSAASSSRPVPRAPPSAPSEASLKKQREQLVELGVEVPSDFRPEMAIPGQWTVTNTRVIETKTEEEEAKVESIAIGVRKREATEDEKEEEEAVRGLFKKPRRWGRDSKSMPQEEDKELDALLSGSTFTPRTTEEVVKKEEEEDDKNVKTEEDTKGDTAPDTTAVKVEAPDVEPSVKPEPEEATSGVQTVVFKKRKPKGIRQK
ncbi:hypothetical protein CEP54_006615 [Fusarium duplospermum]|uniref:U1-type domain-containing protein n=1 Tax=Fusarium duplospermum TaxID=1325734 RepID=A0A428Q621_9HYPO|nr:hypothetical protein CEP54_006615 [Fusarium duplospermum]